MMPPLLPRKNYNISLVQVFTIAAFLLLFYLAWKDSSPMAVILCFVAKNLLYQILILFHLNLLWFPLKWTGSITFGSPLVVSLMFTNLILRQWFELALYRHECLIFIVPLLTYEMYGFFFFFFSQITALDKKYI